MTILKEYLIELLYLLPGIVLALSVHEYAHALVSTKLGDPLPRATGRLTLNPAKHIDPIGFLMLILLRFGWAKPVHVDPRYYKHKKLDMSLVALAGPISNLLLAFVLTFFALWTSLRWDLLAVEGHDGFWMTMLGVVANLLSVALSLNMGLAIFNLIPISPLDGSKILAAFLPLRIYNKILQYERYGFIVLVLLMFDVPVRLLTILGIPAGIAQYFGLYYYLSAARSFVISLFVEIWRPLIRLVV